MTTADDQDSPSLAADASGDFVIMWETEDEVDNDVVARRFDIPAAPGGGGPTGDIADLGKITANGKKVVVNVTCLQAACSVTGRRQGHGAEQGAQEEEGERVEGVQAQAGAEAR